MIMNKLASLIEKGRVVFVALDNKPFAVGETRALAEVKRNSADQIAWVQSVMLENPGQQGCGGRLAVGSANDERPLSTNEKFLQQLGQRTVAELVFEDGFGFRISAGDRIA